MPAFKLQIDAAELEAIATRFAATGKQFEKAMNRSLKRTARHARTVLSKELSKELKIRSKTIKNRIILDLKGNNKTLRLWVGLNPIGLHRLRPKQTKSGIRFGQGNTRKGAFLVRMPNGYTIAMKRKGRRAYPIQKQSLNIHAAGVEAMETKVLPAIEARILKDLETELNFETALK
jgi:hypothetical protein